MVTGVVPSILIDMGVVAGVFVSMSAALAMFWRTPPVKWFQTQVAESMGEWLTGLVETVLERLLAPVIAKLDDLSERFEKHRTYVGYHLGPNGETKPVHQRLCDVEKAVRSAPDDAKEGQ